MAWSLLAIPGAGTIATIAGWATKVVNNFRYLKGIDGVVTTQSGLIVDNSLGTEYVKLPLLSTAECTTVLAAEGQVAHDEALHRIKFHDGTAVRMAVSTNDVDDTPADAATTDPISSNWAYDHLNILTAAGSIPYATAARVWTELGIGTANKFLRVNAGATAPEWAAGALVSIVKTHLRDMDGASGDVAYTGYGFKPAALIIFVKSTTAAYSIGFGDDDLAEMCGYQNTTAPGYLFADTTRIIYLLEAAGTSQAAVLKTLDADGFTLTWTLAGNPTNGNATMIVLALG